MSDEINIKEMSIEDLLELMGEDLYDGYADEIVEEVNECLSRGMIPYDVLTKGLVSGMEIVGNDFRDGILFVPEVLMAAKAMKAKENSSMKRREWTSSSLKKSRTK